MTLTSLPQQEKMVMDLPFKRNIYLILLNKKLNLLILNHFRLLAIHTKITHHLQTSCNIFHYFVFFLQLVPGMIPGRITHWVIPEKGHKLVRHTFSVRVVFMTRFINGIAWWNPHFHFFSFDLSIFQTIFF